MTLRSHVFAALSNDSVLTGLQITSASLFTTHDVDTPQARPFVVLRWQNTVPGLGDDDTRWVNTRRLQVWAHDDPGDYDRIDQILQRVRVVLKQLVGVNTGESGSWIAETNWEGDSDDLSDEAVGTITRNSSYSFTGSAY